MYVTTGRVKEQGENGEKREGKMAKRYVERVPLSMWHQ